MKDKKTSYEFRTFGKDLDAAELKMRELATEEVVREITERYYISENNDNNIAKVRDNKLDIKYLAETANGYEYWAPRLKQPFPLSDKVLNLEVFPSFDVTVPTLLRTKFTCEQMEEEIIKPHEQLQLVVVKKKRTAFTLNNCNCEVAEIEIGNEQLKTIHIRSTNLADITKTRELLEILNRENMNYLKAIKTYFSAS